MVYVENDTRKSSFSSTTNGPTKASLPPDSIVNLDHGDPMIYEKYWEEVGARCTVEIPGDALLSYFSSMEGMCWYMDPQLGDAIRRLHRAVGNAVVEDRHIIVGTGSTQLYLAALYALTSPGGSTPTSVVGAAPYYSAYVDSTQCMRSELFKWEGDAYNFDKDGPYIEVVTSPNNPDGCIREAVVNRDGGKLIHDLAYYWPQYTPISGPADHDIMLFTFSKTAGHAGSRIGWAVVKDKEVARKMIGFIVNTTIGVSKESQVRAAKILEHIIETCKYFGATDPRNFFAYAKNLMAERWEKLQAALKNSTLFSLPKYPQEFCKFTGRYTELYPAFAWLRCDEGIDSESLLAAHKVRGRTGERFGVSRRYVRLSLVGRDEEFNLFLERLPAIEGRSNGISM